MDVQNVHVVVSKNRGTPKWMVYFMENPIKMDDLGGFPPIFGNTHVFAFAWISLRWFFLRIRPHGIHQHLSPPFGIICFYFPSISCKSKFGPSIWVFKAELEAGRLTLILNMIVLKHIFPFKVWQFSGIYSSNFRGRLFFPNPTCSLSIFKNV